MKAGAIGVSTGLYYEPARAALPEEVIEICRPLAKHGGIYCTHMRDEGDRVVDSLEESFRTGRELGVPVVISHHKVVGKANHGRSAETLPIIEQRDALAEDRPRLLSVPRLVDHPLGEPRGERHQGARHLVEAAPRGRPAWSSARSRRTLGLSVYELLPAGAIYFSMDENDVQRILAFEQTMIGSDGLPHDAAPHPRLWGTFPRVLGHYSRDLNLFPLETAVHKMTGLTAKTFGLADRGVLKPGHAADITIFDPKVDETATFAKPIQAAKGIETVIVNGKVVWREGKPTGARPGKVLHRSAR